MQGVLSGQSAALVQVAQLLLMQAWVMQCAGVHASDPVCTQNLWVEQSPPAQSVFAAQGAPPSSSQTPVSHLPLAQSAGSTHPVQTLPAQRWLPQLTSSEHGSPFASLQKPAWQTPLKQSDACVHASPKCFWLPTPVHEP
jgi:hypothetical protein